MKQFWHIYLIGIFLLITGLFYIAWQIDMSSVLFKISKQFFEEPIHDYNRFNSHQYEDVLHFYFAIIGIITGILIILWAKKSPLLVKTCKILVYDFLQFYKNLPVSLKKAVLVLILLNIAVKGFLLGTQPIFTDEAWTYLMFTKKGFLSSLSYYPAPNNHILYSLITNLSSLFGLKLIIALRLPNFMINLWLTLSFIVIFGKLFTPKTGVILAYIFSFGFPMIYYGYIARGYMLYLWGFLVLFYVSIKLINESKLNYKYFCLWLTGSIIGFWAIPAFLYPYLSLTVFTVWYLIKQKSYDTLKYFIKLNSIATFIILVIYTPVFIVSGYKALTANRYVSGMNRWSVFRHFYQHFNDTSWFLFNLPFAVTLIILVTLFIYFYRNDWRPSTILAFYLIASSPLIMIIHSTVPAPRIWIYWLVPFFYLIGFLLENRFKTIYSFKQIMLITGVIVLIQTTIFFNRIKTYEIESYEAQKMTDFLWQKQAKNLYLGKDTYLGASIVFNYLNNHKDIQYKQFFKEWKDTNLKNYDWFLFRYPPNINQCQKLGLKPVRLITRKTSCHHLYHKITQ